MKPDIESIFLAYANLSLRDNPENFYKIFEQVEHHFPTSPNPLRVKAIVKGILTLAKYNDPGVIDTFRETSRKLLEFPAKHPFGVSCEAAYGYRDSYCEEKCIYRTKRREKFGKKLFSGPNRLKCYECEQLAFIHMLFDLVQGKEYSTILDFLGLLANRPLRTIVRTDWASEESPFKQKLTKVITLECGSLLGPGRDGNYKFAFQDFLNKFISYSLTEFLINNDRRKLKRCPVCNTFFLAGNIRKVHCSKECAKIYKRNYQKIWMQKRRDPESPKYDINYIS